MLKLIKYVQILHNSCCNTVSQVFSLKDVTKETASRKVSTINEIYSKCVCPTELH